ncbi:MAG: penicillin-binding protein [Geobacteraceae bacterium GWC2_55_20]|nr:MAG: penicillin-binding protein [Geobacteraceae bacterium GWC2_55_20]OGU25182.1 MAG: penicillin-binding protein [Geobacteraceae bacterium GWF2_54_21]HCE69399.1 penicillin-binding protein [Geobacter sp.]
MHRKAPVAQGNRGFISTLLLCVITLGVVVLLGVSGYIFFLLAKLPRVDRLADYKPPIVSQVFGDDGTLVGEFYLERRIVVPVNKMPRKLIQAFVAAEDANFYSHKGIDYFGIVRAAIKNIISMRKKEGASTITQQVTKSMLLTPEKKFSRKIKEAVLATRMEERLSKDEILYLYLNQIYLGGGSYGVQAAAETYFGKNVDQLNLAEMAMLAGLPKAPNAYSPIKHMEKARERQGYVLDRMVKEGYITPVEAEHARKTPIVIQSMKKVNNEQSAYFLEYLRIQLEQKYGEDQLYKGGLKIYTTMNAAMQRAAFESLRKGLKEVDKRQGFRGATKYLNDADVEAFCSKVEEGIDSAVLKTGETYQGVVVGFNPQKGEILVRVGDRRGILGRKNMSWAGKIGMIDHYGKPDKGSKSLTLGSVIDVSVVSPEVGKDGAQFALDQTPDVQAALVSIDPRTGGVKAMVGGYDFKKSQFNRAIQAKRNAGSAFKPIIYSAALDKGFSPATIIEDTEVEYPDGSGGTWKPKNYDNTFRGPVTMREALTYSINIVSVKIMEQIGAQYAAEYARKFGFVSPIPDNLALALGAATISPFELTAAYTVFANKGLLTPQYFISKVTDAEGTVLQETQPPVPVPVISPENAYVITNLMQSVVASGTGHRASVIGRPVAGKTGTTNDAKDAWFIGFIPQLVTGVWVGYDQERSLGAGGSGGQAAAPIWGDFMQKAVAQLPSEDFEAPENVTFVLINPRTGKLAKEDTPGAVMECFIKGTEPTSYD